MRIAGPDLEADVSSQIEIKDQKVPSHKNKKEEKYISSKDPLLPEIARHIQKTYGAHTIILYGSRAQGTANPKSDYDLFVIRGSRMQKERVKDLFKGASLDLHLFSEEILNDRYLTPSLAIVEGAVILVQKDKIGTQIIQRIKDIYHRGFFPSNKIKKAIIAEIRMKQSKIKNTPEGYFYRNSLLVSLLEHYFTLRNLYFIGTREGFRWLKKNDLAFYNAFEKALKPDASLESLNELVDIVIRGTIFDEKEKKTSLVSQ
jgi:predicted nucleotidyltransferase